MESKHVVKDSTCRRSQNADGIFRLDQKPTLAWAAGLKMLP